MKNEDVGMMRLGNEDRKGDWMETVSGVRFFPLDPRPEDVRHSDIAHHLSRLNRYCGAIKYEHYSVGYHSAIMAEWLYKTYGCPFVAYQGLMHDAPETYISDMVRPLKRQPEMKAFTETEQLIWDRAIVPMDPYLRLAFKLDDRVLEADNRILVDERAQVMNQSGNSWGIDHLEPLGVTLLDISPTAAKLLWLNWFWFLRFQIDHADARLSR